MRRRQFLELCGLAALGVGVGSTGAVAEAPRPGTPTTVYGSTVTFNGNVIGRVSDIGGDQKEHNAPRPAGRDGRIERPTVYVRLLTMEEMAALDETPLIRGDNYR